MRCLAKLAILILLAAMVQIALEGLPGLYKMATVPENGNSIPQDALSTSPGPLLGWVDRTMGGAAWDVKPGAPTRK